VLDEVLATAARGIESVRATLVSADFHKAVALLANAHHVLCIGYGISVAPAQDAAYSLTLIGLKAQSPQDILAQQLTATMLTNNDVYIFISHTGETIPTLTVAQAAQQAGAATIAITSYRRSA
jgi:RpiR family transcriptional regulator, carbohydrate utilization regulator